MNRHFRVHATRPDPDRPGHVLTYADKLDGAHGEASALAILLLESGHTLHRLTWWEIRQSCYAWGCLLCREQHTGPTAAEGKRFTTTHTCPERPDVQPE
jgi:hypothetical protein